MRRDYIPMRFGRKRHSAVVLGVLMLAALFFALLAGGGSARAQTGEAPRFVDPVLSVAIAENIPISAVIAEFTATDDDGADDELYFGLKDRDDARFFAIDEQTGVLFTVYHLDFEMQEIHLVEIMVQDREGRSDEVQLTVNVVDVEDSVSALRVSKANPVQGVQQGNPEHALDDVPENFIEAEAANRSEILRIEVTVESPSPSCGSGIDCVFVTLEAEVSGHEQRLEAMRSLRHGNLFVAAVKLVETEGAGGETVSIIGSDGTPHDVEILEVAERDALAIKSGNMRDTITIDDVDMSALDDGDCANGVAVPDPGNNPGLVQDCAALLAARDILAAEPPLNWSAGNSIYEWEGVGVSDERVVELYLDERNLMGTIPPELGGLSNLETLNLGRNQLNGEIPSDLGNLTNLEYLGLYRNQLEGDIPPELGNLTNLRELYLSENQLDGEIPSELAALTKLEGFAIWRNQIEGEIPSWFGNMTDLEFLVFGENRLSGEIPSELASLTNLTFLNFGGNELSGEIPEWVGDLTELERLFFYDNQHTGAIPPELGNLTNLVHLNIRGNQLTGAIPPELGNLSQLEYLALHNNQLTGEIPSELGDLNKLQYLQLDGNQLGAGIPPELGNLTNLTGLWLRGNQLSGAIPTELGRLSNLTVLNLADNELSGAIPVELSNLTNLTGLWLGDNQLTGAIPVELANLANLEVLWLGNNQLTGAIPVELATLTNLTGLWLNRNQLSGAIPSELANLSNLETLFLSGNRLLTGCVPEALRDVPESDLLELGLPFCGEAPPPPTQIDDCTTLLHGDVTIEGAWISDCASENQSGSYAHYYVFNLSESADVTITMESEHDTFLFLLEGVGTEGEAPHENDDHADERDCNVDLTGDRDSCIRASLDPGDYTIEATTYDPGITGEFTLTVSGIGDAAMPEPTPDPTPDPTPEPTPVPPSGSYTQVVLGELHTCGLRTDGLVACWGNDEYGQASPPGGSFTYIAAGPEHNCGIRTDGSIACWGRNDYGQSSPPSGTGFVSFVVGEYHNCGIREDDSIACWGRNDYGQSTPP